MKADLSIAELLALVDIVDDHADHTLQGIDPPRLLLEVQKKLDAVILRHRQYVESEPPKKKAKAARKA